MRQYEWIADLGSFDVEWDNQRNEWLHWFEECLSERGPVRISGHRYDASTQPFIGFEFETEGQKVPLTLLLDRFEHEVRLYLAADRQVEEHEVTLLVESARCASTHLGAGGYDFTWSALLGHQRKRIPGPVSRLGEEANFDAFRIASSNHVLTEVDDPHQVTLTGWSIQHSVPIFVCGRSNGYSWKAASARATSQLHSLAGLISVAWGECIVLREEPAPLEWGVRRVPDTPPWQSPEMTCPDRPPDVSDFTSANLPAWFSVAWDRLEGSRALADSLAAFHEGMQASVMHPSLALVAFVASIEKIGTLLLEATEKAGFGAAEQFRAGLRRAVNADEAAFLSSAYKARSATVHGGKLHGGETTPGLLRMGVWPLDEESEFRWLLLTRMREASRRLVESVLRFGLTGPSSVDPPST